VDLMVHPACTPIAALFLISAGNTDAIVAMSTVNSVAAAIVTRSIFTKELLRCLQALE
jgi:hypothetical protein